MEANKLTRRERCFCLRQARLQDPAEAARRSGYARPEEAGLLLMAREDVRREVARREAENGGGDLRGRVRAGLERLAFGGAGDAGALLEEEGGARGLPDLYCVSELKKGKNGVEVRYCDRLRALEALLKLDEAQRAGADLLPLCRALLDSAGGGGGGDEA